MYLVPSRRVLVFVVGVELSSFRCSRSYDCSWTCSRAIGRCAEIVAPLSYHCELGMILLTLLMITGLIGLAVAHALAVLSFGMIPSTRHIDARHAVGEHFPL